MIFDREKLDALAAEGWLRSQRHPEADLYIYNYTERCQFEKHWTPETLACRGLILNADSRIAARPFPKFFNLGDPLVGDLPDEPYSVTEKIDGSLGILYHLPDGTPQIATRGSFISEQAIEATRMLADYEMSLGGDTTALFEIVYPSNRIVVDYGDRRELVALACLDRLTARDSGRFTFSGSWVPRIEPLSIDQLAQHERPNAEGYVVTFQSGLRVKIKHADYVRLHRIITGVNARHIWEALRAGQDPVSELDGVPDEIYGWIDSTVASLRTQFNGATFHNARIFDARPDTEDRGEIARYFKASDGNTGALFRMLDGKDFDEILWKAIRPEPTTPDTVWNRALRVES